MKPRELRDGGEQDLFRSRLDQIIDKEHALVRLGCAIDWAFLEEGFGAVYEEGPGRPALPTRLMAGLAILKHMHDLSDESLCERWVENPYYQHFCGGVFFQHRLPFDRSSLTRWRQRMGAERLSALLAESLAAATRMGAAKPQDFARLVIDTTVAEKAVAFPTDARLLHRRVSGWSGWRGRRAWSCARAICGWASWPSSSTGAMRTRTSSSAPTRLCAS